MLPVLQPVVGIAGVIFDAAQPLARRVLLIQRGKPPQKGVWSLPGGRLQLGERLRAGMEREVREETGIRVLPAPDTVPPAAAVDVMERLPTSSAFSFHYTIVDLIGFGRGNPVAGDDAQDARWVDVKNIGKQLEVHNGLQSTVDSALRLIDAGIIAWPTDEELKAAET